MTLQAITFVCSRGEASGGDTMLRYMIRARRFGPAASTVAEQQPGSRGRQRLLHLWLCMLAVSIGCGPSARIGDGTDPWASSVGQAARLVARYRIAHRGQMPEDPQALRSFAATIDPADLEPLGIGSIEECFVSERDGQPLEFLLGQPDRRGGDPSVICYEREGRGGVRLVGKLGGDVEAADAQRFAELVGTDQAATAP